MMRNLLSRHALGRKAQNMRSRIACYMHQMASLQVSLESSVELLLLNRPTSFISRFNETADRDMNELHPLEKNVLALGLLFSGDIEKAITVQSQTVKDFTQSVGSTSDSFLDIAGSINDLAVMHIANKDYISAEKQLKRAILMVDRSYRIDNHLKATLLANLIDLNLLQDKKDKSLQYADQLFLLLYSNNINKKKAIDIALLNPAESNELHDRFWKKELEDQKKAKNIGNGASNSIQNRFYYSKEMFSSIRQVQFLLSFGHCVGQLRLHEEGLIYLNKAFDTILLDSVNPLKETGALFIRDSFLVSVALSKLASLADHSMRTRGKGLSAKHVQSDNLSKLFSLPYFKENFPSVSDLDLCLTSPYRDLKNAATQIHKKNASPHLFSNTDLKYSEYDLVLRTGMGVVGVSLMDIEHHCPL